MLVTIDIDEVAEVVNAAIERAIAPLISREKALRDEIDRLRGGLEATRDPPAVDRQQLELLVAAAVAKARDADVEVLRDLIAEQLADFPAVRDGQDGKDGEDGAPGQDGKDGEDGAPGADGKGVDMAEMIRLLDGTVAKAIEALPAPRDGKDGESVSIEAVSALVTDTVAKAVAALPVPKNGQDGIGVAGAMIDRQGSLIVTLSNGATKDLGLIVGKDGAPGRDGIDGVDGLSVEDLSVEYDDERCLVFRFARGEIVRDFRVKMPLPLYRGVWREGGSYEKGDMVTWAGSQFIAKADTKAKPETTPDWVLSTKRGRDGKDGAAGKDGKPGPEGKPGRDGYSR